VGEEGDGQSATIKEGVFKLWTLNKDRRFIYIIP